MAHLHRNILSRRSVKAARSSCSGIVLRLQEDDTCHVNRRVSQFPQAGKAGFTGVCAEPPRGNEVVHRPRATRLVTGSIVHPRRTAFFRGRQIGTHMTTHPPNEKIWAPWLTLPVVDRDGVALAGQHLSGFPQLDFPCLFWGAIYPQQRPQGLTAHFTDERLRLRGRRGEPSPWPVASSPGRGLENLLHPCHRLPVVPQGLLFAFLLK